MKHRVVAKKKNMYVLLGLLALLLGSLAYLGSQRGSREGMTVEERKAARKANKDKKDTAAKKDKKKTAEAKKDKKDAKKAKKNEPAAV